VVSVRTAVTRPMQVTVRVSVDGDRLGAHDVALEPGQVDVRLVRLPDGTDAGDVRVQLSEGPRTVLEWRLCRPSEEEPWLATVPPLPKDTETVDELYLTGLHLEQYRHPTRLPAPYWEEAIRRDPGDSRSRLALAWRAYRSGQYALAEEHLRI